jgi:uncharacterized protein (TIGR03067 family)
MKPDEIGGMSMEFEGERVRVSGPADAGEGTFTLDPAKDPTQPDILGSRGRLRGIYRFVGDELEICMDGFDAMRPICWKTEPGTSKRAAAN